VQWGWTKVVQYLIAHGAKVDVKDDRGVSPLDAASGKGSADNHPSGEVAKIIQTAIAKKECRCCEWVRSSPNGSS
jgi:hypothetical protein